MVCVVWSITGVPWMPMFPMMLPVFTGRMSVIGTGVTDGGLVKSVTHRGTGDGLSASNAYTLSVIVATYSTL
jgi:hypothetical protein